MNRKSVIKLVTILIGVLFVAPFVRSHVFAWGSATHAYIDDHLGKSGPLKNLNEMYGGMATDVFNYLFSNLDWLNYFYMETHYENNIALCNEADTTLEKAVAFGYTSHDAVIGADATAHGTYDYAAPYGYVIEKAVAMAEIPEVKSFLNSFGMVQNDLVTVAGYELCHTFVESAVDLLIAGGDRDLGRKISAAAVVRTPEFPSLLVKAYARGFAETFGVKYRAAVSTIRSAESEFRRNMISYGFALAQEPEIAQGLICEQLASLAPAFLAAYGVTVPEDADLTALSNYLMGFAIVVCEADYLATVNETITFVSTNLASMGISY